MTKLLCKFIGETINTSKRSFHVFIVLFFLLFLTYNLGISLKIDSSTNKALQLHQESLSSLNVIEILINIKDINTQSNLLTKSYILLNPSLTKISIIKDYYENNFKIINIDVYNSKKDKIK